MIGWIVFGLLVGILAKILLPVRGPGGFGFPMLLGLAGALLGGLLGRFFDWYGDSDPIGSIMAAAGAMVILIAHRLLTHPRRA